RRHRPTDLGRVREDQREGMKRVILSLVLGLAACASSHTTGPEVSEERQSMMRLGRTAALLVAISLFTSTATAYAACAWVRWFHAPEGSRGMGGFSSLEACDAAITRAVSRLPPQEVVRDKGFSS